MTEKIEIAREFSGYLVNRNPRQGDGSNNGEQFREKFLKDLNEDWWKSERRLVFDFLGVRTLGPSWANEVFAFYTDKYDRKLILKKFIFENISPVKLEIIHLEIESGYKTNIVAK